MRELFWMSDGRRRDEWMRTARVCATIANSSRDPSTRPFEDADFNPFAPPRKKQVIKAPITILKSIFLSPEKREAI